MGAYLSVPNVEKVSDDYEGETMSYGASSMQGWRIAQEDAHNACMTFDPERKTSLFAVYDGHGGSEVAQYCSSHLPDFLKELQSYKEGNISQALEDAFLKFDETLTREEVVHELKQIAQLDDDGDADEEREEAAELVEEATMPIEDLLAKYGTDGPPSKVDAIKEKPDVLSPMLKGKKGVGKKSKKCTSNGNSVNGNSVNGNGDEIKINLDAQLANGHADNENNQNIEKERADGTVKEETKTEAEIKRESAEQMIKQMKEDLKKGASNDTTLNVKDGEEKNMDTSDNKEKECADGTAEEETKTEAEIKAERFKQMDILKNNMDTSDKKDTIEKSETINSETDTVNTSSEKTEDVTPDTVAESKAGEKPSEKNETKPSSTSSGSSSGGSGSNIALAGTTFKSIDDIADEDSEEDSDDEYVEGQEEEESDEEDEEEDGAEDKEDEDEDDDDELEETECASEEPGSDSGCTAVLALIKDNELYVANAGDSRCVLSRNGVAMEMSFDHKPEDEIELKRIHAAGGEVTPDGRVNGNLNLSRAIGDHAYKTTKDIALKDQMITALPDVKSTKLEEGDEFLVLACDGIWNCLTSQEVVDFVKQRLQDEKKRKTPSIICEEIFDRCLAPDTMGDGTGCDNMTCIIVVFNKLSAPTVKRPSCTRELEDENCPKKLKPDEEVSDEK
ncbi:unnamed protein product [Owenia fusiformis]|uniref:protein-serine/threonine phosphatase n=1 Tax=Owenia fusiformis TaxID=6347 RepID=A0A8J1U7T3_OWEFU|nr:unnamed protein product [Owenia fusiformis]